MKFATVAFIDVIHYYNNFIMKNIADIFTTLLNKSCMDYRFVRCNYLMAI